MPVLMLFLPAVALAGCLGSGAGNVAAPSGLAEATTADDLLDNSTALAAQAFARPTLIETELGALADIANATRDDWFVLVGPSGPDGNLTGFRWTVPEGSVVPECCEDTYGLPGERRPTLLLEVVPLVPQGADPEGVYQLNLLAFRRDGPGVSLVNYWSQGWWYERSEIGPVRYEYRYEFAMLEAAFFRLGYDEVKDGEELYFVLNADAAVPSELAIAFRVMPDDPGCCPDAAEDFEAFRSERETPHPYALPRTGSGSGYSYPTYYEGAAYYGIHYEGWTQMVTIERGLPAEAWAAPVRDLALSFEFPSERGWGYGYAYAGLANSGQWSYRYDLHGVKGESSGVVASGCTPPPGLYCLEADDYEVTAEGEGSSAARYELLQVEPGPFPYIGFEHLELGATLEELIGVPDSEAEDGGAAARNVLAQRFGADSPFLPPWAR